MTKVSRYDVCRRVIVPLRCIEIFNKKKTCSDKTVVVQKPDLL